MMMAARQRKLFNAWWIEWEQLSPNCYIFNLAPSFSALSQWQKDLCLYTSYHKSWEEGVNLYQKLIEDIRKERELASEKTVAQFIKINHLFPQGTYPKPEITEGEEDSNIS
jgi:hypothetical protein